MPLQLLSNPGASIPGALIPGAGDPGFPDSAEWGGFVTLDDDQEITGAKTFDSVTTFDAPVHITVPVAAPDNYALVISQDGSKTSAGAFVFWEYGLSSFFGIYDPTNSLYYGITPLLSGSSVVAAIGGYYRGMGIIGATAGAGWPIFGVLNSGQSGNGIGNVAFTIYDTNKIVTLNSTLDDGSGNMTLAGGLACHLRTVTSNVAVSATDSTVLLNGATLTATLPDASGIAGRSYTVKLVAASTTGTVATTASQTIDGAATCSLSAQYKSVTVQSDGSNWFITASNLAPGGL